MAREWWESRLSTEEQKTKKLDSAILALWERFRPLNEGRLRAIQSAARAARDGSLNGPTRRTAEDEAHKLAGAAGSYGFPRISEISREIELCLQGDGPLEEESVGRLCALAEELARELQRSRTEKNHNND